MPEVVPFRNPVESPTFYSWLSLNQTNQGSRVDVAVRKITSLRSPILPRNRRLERDDIIDPYQALGRNLRHSRGWKASSGA